MNLTAWPHAPTHRLSEAGTYFVTAGTYLKAHHFRGAERCAVLHCGLLKVLGEAGWQLEAWAVFSNHYHFVAHSPPTGGEGLSAALRQLHLKTATWVNRVEGKPKRKVWHNFWESRLTYQPSYLARLKYVHHNAVRHGLVCLPRDYPWCSAGWFERSVAPAEVRNLYGFKIDAVSVMDDYEPLAECDSFGEGDGRTVSKSEGIGAESESGVSRRTPNLRRRRWRLRGGGEWIKRVGHVALFLLEGLSARCAVCWAGSCAGEGAG